MTVDVCLRTADQEVHVGVGGGAGLADQVAGALAVLVSAVAARLFHVGSDEGIEHPGVRAFLVVTGEVRQRMGRIHAAIIPRGAALRGQTDLRGFPSRYALQLRQSVFNIHGLNTWIRGQLLRFQHRQDSLTLLLIQTQIEGHSTHPHALT